MQRIALLSLLALAACGEEKPPLGVMTFNVLCSFCDDTYDRWEDRLRYFGDIFARHQPALIGLQEITTAREVDQVLKVAPPYAALFFDGPDANGEITQFPDATILYQKERFELVDRGSFWLSPTPDVPFTHGFADPQLPRLVVFAQLRELETDRTLAFATTHFDNNAPSQAKSAPLVRERFADLAPLIFVGDYNSKPDSLAYSILVGTATASAPGRPFVDAYDLAQEHTMDGGSDYDATQRIDHVFLGDSITWSVNRWTVDLQRYGESDRFPSDHRAIAVELLWAE